MYDLKEYSLDDLVDPKRFCHPEIHKWNVSQLLRLPPSSKKIGRANNHDLPSQYTIFYFIRHRPKSIIEMRRRKASITARMVQK